MQVYTPYSSRAEGYHLKQVLFSSVVRSDLDQQSTSRRGQNYVLASKHDTVSETGKTLEAEICFNLTGKRKRQDAD